MRQYHYFSQGHRRPFRLAGLLHWAIRLSIAASIPVLSLGFQAELVQAYPRQTSVAVVQQQGDSYTALVRRAETAARTATQRIFDSDILVSEVAVTVVGESGSSIVPILTLRVDRDQWRRRPDPQQWSTYFRSARSLLELGTPAGSPPTVSAPIPAAPDSAPIAPSGTVAPAPVPPANTPPTNAVPSGQPATPSAGQPLPAQTVPPLNPSVSPFDSSPLR